MRRKVHPLALIAVFIALLWMLLAVCFSVSRHLWCQPLLSQACGKLAVKQLGDVVLLNWLDHWQTLAAGLIAIVAALIGGAYIQNQDTERYRRKHAAARAVLPLALDAFSRYAIQIGTVLKDLHRQAVGETVPHTASVRPIPPLPTEAIPVLANLVEICERGQDKLFAAVISQAQVLSARMDTLGRNVHQSGFTVTVRNLEDYICDAAEIYAKAGALFPYARRETECIPLVVTIQEAMQALRILGFRDTTRYGRLHSHVERRVREEAPPSATSWLWRLAARPNPGPSSARQ